MELWELLIVVGLPMAFLLGFGLWALVLSMRDAMYWRIDDDELLDLGP